MQNKQRHRAGPGPLCLEGAGKSTHMEAMPAPALAVGLEQVTLLASYPCYTIKLLTPGGLARAAGLRSGLMTTSSFFLSPIPSHSKLKKKKEY